MNPADIIINGINNTKIVVKTSKYEVPIEWELQHRCVGDCWHSISKEEVEKLTPVKCLMCGKDLIEYKVVK